MNKRCVIISASPNFSAEHCKSRINDDDFIICADGGLKHAFSAGLTPDLIIGDFDSYTDILPTGVKTISLNKRKDATDTFICAQEAFKRGFGEILLLGAAGGRYDHAYANYCVLSYLEDKKITASLSDEAADVFIVANRELKTVQPKGTVVSVFPFGCETVFIEYKGFEYSPESGCLKLDGTAGTSNVTSDINTCISIKEGTAIVFINRFDVERP